MGIRRVLAIFACAFLSIPACALGVDAPCRLVDTPTAGSLSSRQYLLESQLFDGGGLVQRVLFGLNSYVNVGLSYGGSNIVGSERVAWQPHVGFQVRVRLIEESPRSPALSLGFDSQGEGPFLRGERLNRFRDKSRGVYLALSRNYRFFGNLGFHGGVNYSLETDDEDIDPSFWVGFDKSLGSGIDLCGEYDFAVNDDAPHSMTGDRGRLNTAVKWRFGKGFVLELDIRNLLRADRRDPSGSVQSTPEPSRELRFYYSGTF